MLRSLPALILVSFVSTSARADFVASDGGGYKRNDDGTWTCAQEWEAGSYEGQPIVSFAGVYGELGIAATSRENKDGDKTNSPWGVGLNAEAFRSFGPLLKAYGNFRMQRVAATDEADALVFSQAQGLAMIGNAREYEGPFRLIMESHSTKIDSDTTLTKQIYCAESSAYRENWGVGIGLQYDTLTGTAFPIVAYMEASSGWRKNAELTDMQYYWVGYKGGDKVTKKRTAFGIGVRYSAFTEAIDTTWGFGTDIFVGGQDADTEDDKDLGGALLLSIYVGAGVANMF